jgi:hypothetical protein
MFIGDMKALIEKSEYFENIFSSCEEGAVIFNYISSGNFILMYFVNG